MRVWQLTDADKLGQRWQVTLSVPFGHAGAIGQVETDELDEQTVLVHARALLRQETEHLVTSRERMVCGVDELNLNVVECLQLRLGPSKRLLDVALRWSRQIHVLWTRAVRRLTVVVERWIVGLVAGGEHEWRQVDERVWRHRAGQGHSAVVLLDRCVAGGRWTRQSQSWLVLRNWHWLRRLVTDDGHLRIARAVAARYGRRVVERRNLRHILGHVLGRNNWLVHRLLHILLLLLLQWLHVRLLRLHVWLLRLHVWLLYWQVWLLRLQVLLLRLVVAKGLDDLRNRLAGSDELLGGQLWRHVKLLLFRWQCIIALDQLQVLNVFPIGSWLGVDLLSALHIGRAHQRYQQ